MRIVARSLTVLQLMLAMAGSAALAGGDPSREALNAMAREASLHYRLGRFSQALATYEKIFEHRQHPLVIFNLAQCHRELSAGQVDARRRLHHMTRAIFFYQLHLSRWARVRPGQPSPYRKEADLHTQRLTRQKAALAGQIARQKKIQIGAQPTKTPGGKTPGGKTPRTSPPAPVAAPATRPAASPARDAAGRGVDGAGAARAPVVDRTEPPKLRRWAWSTLGLAAACGMSAAVFYGVARSRGTAAHDRYAALPTGTPVSEFDARWEEVEAAERLMIGGHVLIGAAAAALGASIYLFLTRRARERRTAAEGLTAYLSVGLGPRDAGVWLKGKF